MEENSPTPPAPHTPELPMAQTPDQESSQPPQPLPSTPVQTVTGKKSKKPILIIIIVLFVIIVILGLGLVLINLSKGQNQQVISPTPTPFVEPKEDQLSNIQNSIENGENTVSVASSDGQYFLRYKDKYYQVNDEGIADLESFNLENPDSYTWHGLTEITQGEVFDFVALPTINPGFAFIMRYPLDGKDHYELYYYAYDEINSIASFDPDPEKLVYRIPKFYSINSAGTLGGLHMYDCWECERHYPQTLVVNFITKESQVLGPTSYFAWGLDENFEYKDYVANQDPATLPLKKGGFKF